ncbi:MAG TPA: energy transducer TonB [Kofleriaceae bacterium]|nr:energy transducer TonB [Kofleriaceae bacterium]
MKLLISCFAASACASATPVADMPASPRSHAVVHVDVVPPHRAFPTRIGAAELPIADTMREWFADRDHLTAHVQLCVAPSGKTVHVGLAASSGNSTFDEAVVTDVSRWRYEPFVSSSPRCEPATVTYLL